MKGHKGKRHQVMEIRMKKVASIFNKASGFIHIFSVITISVFLSAIIRIECDKYSQYETHDNILDAVTYNDFDTVKRLIKEGVDLNTKDDSGNTPLHWASSVSMAELLLKNGADIHSRNNMGGTPLHTASSWGRSNIVSFFIAQGADIHAKDEFGGDMPIHYAAKGGDIATIRVLIKAGSNINEKNNSGSTPIFNAIANNSVEAVEFLINQGADLSAVKSKTWGPITPLERALIPIHYDGKDHFNESIIETIVKYTDVNAKDADGETLFERALRQLDNYSQYKIVIKLIIDRVDDINATDETGHTPLDQAYEYRRTEKGFIEIPKDKEIVNLLISKGAKRGKGKDTVAGLNEWFNKRRERKKRFEDTIKQIIADGGDLNKPIHGSNYPPLIRAIMEKDYDEIAVLIIKSGADVNIKRDNGAAPLHLAVESNNTDIVKLLIEHGANVNIKDNNRGGLTPFGYAIPHGKNIELLQYLIDQGAKINYKMLIEAILHGSTQLTQLLLDNGLDAHYKDKNNYTMLHWATMSNMASNEEIIKILLQAGVDVNAISSFGNGHTALDYAIATHPNNKKLHKLLRDHGAKSARELE